MAIIRRNAPVAASFTLIAALFLAAVIACACQSSRIGSGSTSDLELSFRVLGIGPSAQTGPSASRSPSFLLLPTASTLTVSLTPLDSGLQTPAPQTISIPSSGGNPVLSVSFPDVEWGNYTISAVAANSSGQAQFRQSSTLTVSESTTAATLNLVPANVDTTKITGSGWSGTLSVTIAPGEVFAYAVPTSMLSNGSSIPVNEYQFTVTYSMSMGSKVYALDADGKLLMSGDIDYGTSIVITGGTSTFVSSSTVNIGPCSSSAPSFLIFYNGSSSGPLQFSLNNYMS
jgi:hypothetical protein